MSTQWVLRVGDYSAADNGKGERLMKRVLPLLAILAASVVAPAKLSANTIFPAIGGSGDSQVADRCPAGMWLVGLKGRGGLWIDRVQIACSRLSADGMTAQGALWYGPARGGNGGAPQEYRCPVSAAAYVAAPTMTPDNRQVKFVEVRCWHLKENRLYGNFWFNSGPASAGGRTSAKEPPPMTCPPGELANGFAINFGMHVNALGLLCRRR
jgi:hypothetical protein